MFSGCNDTSKDVDSSNIQGDSVKPLSESDFTIADGKSSIGLYKEFKDLKIEKQELKNENNYVGEIASGDYFYKYYIHNYDDFDLYLSNANYNLKGKKFDDRYIAQITLKNKCNFKTSRGITIGSSLKNVMDAYGQRTAINVNGVDCLEYQFNDMGLCFDINSNQTVSRIVLNIIVKKN